MYSHAQLLTELQTTKASHSSVTERDENLATRGGQNIVQNQGLCYADEFPSLLAVSKTFVFIIIF